MNLDIHADVQVSVYISVDVDVRIQTIEVYMLACVDVGNLSHKFI